MAGDDAAAPEHVQRVGQFVDLRQIGGNHDDAGAALQQRARAADRSRPWCRRRRPTVGSSKMNSLAPWLSHLPITIFCWLPPEGWQTWAVPGRGLDLQVPDLLLGGARSRRRAIDDGPRGQPIEDRQVDVEADAEVEAKALVAPAFRRQRDAEVHRVALVPDRRPACPARGSRPPSPESGRTGFARIRCGRRRSGHKGRRSRLRVP